MLISSCVWPYRVTPRFSRPRRCFGTRHQGHSNRLRRCWELPWPDTTWWPRSECDLWVWKGCRLPSAASPPSLPAASGRVTNMEGTPENLAEVFTFLRSMARHKHADKIGRGPRSEVHQASRSQLRTGLGVRTRRADLDRVSKYAARACLSQFANRGSESVYLSQFASRLGKPAARDRARPGLSLSASFLESRLSKRCWALRTSLGWRCPRRIWDLQSASKSLETRGKMVKAPTISLCPVAASSPISILTG
jgi:hypothetical protein